MQLSQMRRSTFLPLQDADPTPSFGGFGHKGSGVALSRRPLKL